jgi:hypothetical protein
LSKVPVYQNPEKVFFQRLIKNTWMKVERREIPPAEVPEILCREWFETVPYRLLYFACSG